MADTVLDPVLAVIAIGATIATAASGLIAVVIREWRGASSTLVKVLQDTIVSDRARAAEDLEHERLRTAEAVADRRSAQQQLQFISETMRVQADASERAISISEQLFDREQRSPSARDRASDRPRGRGRGEPVGG